MALIEAVPETEEEFEPKQVTVQLWPDDVEFLDRLTERTGLGLSELLPHALGALWRELEGIVLPPPEPGAFVDMEQALRESEEDVRASRTSTNEEVFARIDAKHGW